jgi:hypothetical protein
MELSDFLNRFWFREYLRTAVGLKLNLKVVRVIGIVLVMINEAFLRSGEFFGWNNRNDE